MRLLCARRCAAQLSPACPRNSFPSLPALRRLQLSDNRISGGLEALAAGAPGVESLNLSNCKIPSVEALRPLASLASLSALDLTGCPLASGDDAAYRAAVFALLPQLKMLDRRGAAPDAEECVAVPCLAAHACALHRCCRGLTRMRMRDAQGGVGRRGG